MTKFLIIYGIVLLIGMIGGWYLGVTFFSRHASDGVCMRTDEGEVYLRMSEAGQIKLSDPKTKYLMLKVKDVSTRNNHPL